jgi:hypothetical protein
VDIEAWGKQGELVSKYLGKGSQCMVEGRLKLDQWEDKTSGQKRSRLKVVLENVQFLGAPRVARVQRRARRSCRSTRTSIDQTALSYERTSPPPRRRLLRPRRHDRRRRTVLTTKPPDAVPVATGGRCAHPPPPLSTRHPSWLTMKFSSFKPVEGLGGEGDQVKVRAGYARNFLLPRKIAVPVTRANKKHVEALRKRRAEREASELSGAQEIARKLEKTSSRLPSRPAKAARCSERSPRPTSTTSLSRRASP